MHQDFADYTQAQGDLVWTSSQRPKIYNILAYYFEESPQLWLELSQLIDLQTTLAVRSATIADHLRDFACAVEHFRIDHHQQQGQLHLHITERQAA